MYITCKVALQPTKEQEELFWKWSNAARFIYNFALDIKTTSYNNDGVKLRWNDIVKYITKIKYTEQYNWLAEVPSETIKCAVKDMDSAFKKFSKVEAFQSSRRNLKQHHHFTHDMINYTL